MINKRQSVLASSPNKKTLDVGCGQNRFPGAIGIDANPRSHADVIHDLGNFPYPFSDDEFDEIICRHVIEHVPDVLAFVNELHRITKAGGRLKIVTPHYSNPDWATDPTHRNHFNSYSFTCFMPALTPFPFYTEAELRPIRTHVTLANLWRAIGLEALVNLDQVAPAFRFTRKFWEFYLSNIVRGKELSFEFEIVKLPRENVDAANEVNRSYSTESEATGYSTESTATGHSTESAATGSNSQSTN